MKKGKEPAEYTSDEEPTTDHSEEEVELNNGEMMNAPEEKTMSDAAKLAESKVIKRLQRYRDNDRRRREKNLNYITSLEKEKENLTYSISTATSTINILSHTWQREQFQKQIWSTRLQSLNEGQIQSLEENRRLQQERIDLENLQQEQSRAPNAAQDPNSMLEPRQIQTSGLSHQYAHQLGGPHNATYHPYGLMVPQQILTSGPLRQQAHQPGGPHNAVYHSSGILVPQQIQTSGLLRQQAHQLGGPHNAAYDSSGIMVPQQIQTSGLSHQHAHQLGGPHNAAYDSSGIMVQQQIQTSGLSHQTGGPHNAARHSYELGQSSASQEGVYDNPSRTWVAWVESCLNDSDQDIPSPHLSADDSVLGSEMPSMAQLQEGMSSTDVEKVTSDGGQIE